MGNGRLKWDQAGHRDFEAGISRVVLYPTHTATSDKTYGDGVAWNGCTAVNERPGGADKSDLWADNKKYASLRAAETFGGTIEAYTYPDEWAECDGSKEVYDGVVIGQQDRHAFGLCYRTEIGDDEHPGINKGYKLHLAYNLSVNPSEKQYQTINENPDAITFSWEFDSIPVELDDETLKPTAIITIDSTKADADALKELEDMLYGTDATTGTGATEATAPTLPDAQDVLDMFKTTP